MRFCPVVFRSGSAGRRPDHCEPDQLHPPGPPGALRPRPDHLLHGQRELLPGDVQQSQRSRPADRKVAGQGCRARPGGGDGGKLHPGPRLWVSEHPGGEQVPSSPPSSWEHRQALAPPGSVTHPLPPSTWRPLCLRKVERGHLSTQGDSAPSRMFHLFCLQGKNKRPPILYAELS